MIFTFFRGKFCNFGANYHLRWNYVNHRRNNKKLNFENKYIIYIAIDSFPERWCSENLARLMLYPRRGLVSGRDGCGKTARQG